MDYQEFKRLYLGDFPAPSQRYMDLFERLTKYYRDTPDEMGNKEALKHWRLFNEWCKDRGYSLDEINEAKRNYRH